MDKCHFKLWSKKKVSNLDGKFRTEGTDNIVETSLLRSHSSRSELGLYLSEPNFCLADQNGGSLMLTAAREGISVSNSHCALLSSVKVTNLV